MKVLEIIVEEAPATAPLPELRPKNFDQIVARYKNKKPSALAELLKKFAPDILILIAAAIGLAHLSFLQKFFIKQGINFSKKQMQKAMAQAESIEEARRPSNVDPAQNPYVKQEKDTDIVLYCEFDDAGKRACKKVKRGDIKDKINYLHKHADMVNGNMMDIYTDTLNSPDKLYSIVTFTKEIDGKMYKVWADQNTKKIIKKELMY
jgi:hypothetical protein